MKQCLIIRNTFNNEIPFTVQAICDFLVERDIGVKVCNYSGQKQVADTRGCDFAITLGGDGTVLYAARTCAPLNIPIFPINLGQFGFIAGIQKDNWQSELDKFLKGKLKIAKRTMIQAELYRKDKLLFLSSALNDIVISAQTARMVSLDIKCNEIPFGLFRCDGIIACTSTGSTAYSASAGGPLVDPRLDSIILNTICPFSLAGRPLVLPDSAVLTIQMLPSRGGEPVISCDGQEPFKLKVDDKIIIQKSEKKVLLAGCDTRIFYEALKSKMHWFGGLS